MRVQQILDLIDSGDVALPEFQRGYVWNREQVRGLFTSLYRGYPVGGFLVWHTMGGGAAQRGVGTGRAQRPNPLPVEVVGRGLLGRSVSRGVAGHEVVGLNAGPEFHLNEAFSFYLRLDGQDEVDQHWEILTADGGEPGPCGWCKDKFGVSWQVIPRELEELSGDYTTAVNQRVCQAMLKMGKIDVAELQAAYYAA